MRVAIEYYSHYRKELIRSTYLDLAQRVWVRGHYDPNYADQQRLAKYVYRRLRSKDAAQNNFWVKVTFSPNNAEVLFDLSNGKLVEEFEVKQVLRFPRKKKAKSAP